MAATEIVELNHRHMAIAEYILANPAATLKEVAAAVGLSPSWISIVTNSQLFREYLQQRNREIAEGVHLSLQEKVAGIAHRAVEKLGEAVDNSDDPAFILATADKTLQRLGYGAKAPAVQVNNAPAGAGAPQYHNHVHLEVIAGAREKMIQLAQEGGKPLHDPAAIEVQPREADSLGAPVPKALVHQGEEAPRTETPGAAVREEGNSTPGRDPAVAGSPGPVD